MDVIILFMLFGFITQIIDGTIGMGYVVILTTLLISMGIPPVSASASVHAATLCKKLPAKILMILVGLLVVVLSMRTIIITWFYIN